MKMGTSLAQVFSEARSLVTKLHDREKLADGMVVQAQTLHEKINCMKEVRGRVVKTLHRVAGSSWP